MQTLAWNLTFPTLNEYPEQIKQLKDWISKRHSIQGWQTDATAAILLCCTLGTLLVAGCLMVCCSEREKPAARNALPLDVLASVITPVRFSHPTRYTTMLAHSVDLGSSTIVVDAPKAFERLVLGDAEVKGSQFLQDMLSNRLKVGGWSISMSFDWRWKLWTLRCLAFGISKGKKGIMTPSSKG
jgi:hypothetical protein